METLWHDDVWVTWHIDLWSSSDEASSGVGGLHGVIYISVLEKRDLHLTTAINLMRSAPSENNNFYCIRWVSLKTDRKLTFRTLIKWMCHVRLFCCLQCRRLALSACLSFHFNFFTFITFGNVLAGTPPPPGKSINVTGTRGNNSQCHLVSLCWNTDRSILGPASGADLGRWETALMWSFSADTDLSKMFRLKVAVVSESCILCSRQSLK